MLLTTLCYLEKDGAYLMLHRTKKKKDVNEGKWIGVGGKFEEGETPEDCVRREVTEETGFIIQNLSLRGVLTFSSEGWDSELIFVYTSDDFIGEMIDCTEGELRWVKKEDILSLKLWQGDRLFLKMLIEKAPFFSMKLAYQGGTLAEWRTEYPI